MLDGSLIERLALLLRGHPRIRFWVFLVGAVGVVSAGMLYVLGDALFKPIDRLNVAVVVGIPSALTLAVVVESLLLEGGGGSSPGGELDLIRVERQALRERLSATESADVFSSLELNLNQLREFYVLSRAQARGSFRLGVASAFGGLVALIASVGILIGRSGDPSAAAVLTAVGGALGQFVAISCFYLYRRALDQLNRFFGQLALLQQVMLAVRLTESVENRELRDDSRRLVIQSLLTPPAPAPPPST